MSVRLNVGELPGKPQGSRSATSDSLFRLEVTQSRTEWSFVTPQTFCLNLYQTNKINNPELNVLQLYDGVMDFV